MKPCPCGSPATHERPIPWDPIRMEGVCQGCADRTAGRRTIHVIGQAPVTLTPDVAAALHDLWLLDGDRGVGHSDVVEQLEAAGLARSHRKTTKALGRVNHRIHASTATITPLGRRIAAALHHQTRAAEAAA